MSSLTFKAVIGGVHFDPKKGIVKIQLEATSYVSLDELTSLGPQDESVRITLESEQTRIGEHPLIPTDGDPVAPAAPGIDEEGAEWLKEAAGKLRDDPDAEGGEGQDKDPEAADEDTEE